MILASSTLSWSSSISDIMVRVGELGLDGIEVWIEHLWRTGEEAHVLRDTAERLGLACTIHGPSWDLNLCSIDREMLQASRRCTCNAIDLAADLGASSLVVHPGRESLLDHFREYHWRELQRSYIELCAYAADRNVVIALEAMEKIPKEFLCEPEIVNRFVREVRSKNVSNIGVTVDLAHLTTVSTDPLGCLTAFDSVMEIHISNATAAKLHTPLPDGDLDYSRIIPILTSKYEVPIVIEGLSDVAGFALLEQNAQLAREVAR